MYQMWVGSLPHSWRIRLQCDGVETPDGARRLTPTSAISGALPRAPATVPCAYAFDRGWTADGAGDGALCVRLRSRVDCRRP